MGKQAAFYDSFVTIKKIEEKLLEEGYKASNAEGLQLTKEFDSVDMENWDEY